MKDSVRLLPLNIINKNLPKLSLILSTSECSPLIFLTKYPPFFLETKFTPLLHIFFPNINALFKQLLSRFSPHRTLKLLPKSHSSLITPLINIKYR